MLWKGEAVSFDRLLNGHTSAHYICGRREFAALGAPAGLGPDLVRTWSGIRLTLLEK